MKTAENRPDEITEKALTCDTRENIGDPPLEVTWAATPLVL
jgi:hypothetical protein